MRMDFAMWLLDGAEALGRRAQGGGQPAEPAVSEHSIGNKRIVRFRNASPADLVAAMRGAKVNV